MNIFQFSIFSSLLATIGLGVLVFVTKSRRPANQSFLIFTIIVSFYMLFFALGSLATDVDTLAFWIRQTSAVSALTPFAMNLIRLAITARRGWREIARRSAWFLAGAIITALVCQTDWFLRGATLPLAGQTVGVPVYGHGFFLFAVYFISAWAALIAGFLRDRRRATGIERTELEFVLIACGGGLFLGMFFLFLPLLLGNQEVGQVLPFSILFLDSIIAYGIATRRILDVPQVLSRIVSYTLLTLYLSLLYAAVWLPADGLVHFLIQTELPLSHFIAMTAVVLSVVPAHGRLQEIVNRLLGTARAFDASSTLDRGLRVLGSIATLDELLAQFAAVIQAGVGTDHARLLLREDGMFRQAHPATATPVVVSAQDPLLRILKEQREPLSADLLPRYTFSTLRTEAGESLEELKATVAVGIETKGSIEALLLLGPRRSGRIYATPELNTLQILANHLGVALENAKLYTQVQDNAIYTNNLLENLVNGVIAAGADRRITVFNREAQNITGLDPREIIGQPFEKLPAPFASVLQDVFESGTGPREKELGLNPGSRENQLTVRAGGTLFHGSKGQLLGALLVFQDVTALKRLESQVRRGDRLASMGTLAAGMAHEIKNPLQTLKTFTQLLNDRFDDPEFRGSFTELVGSEVQRIDALVNQLLRFARPAKPVLVPMHLHAVVENTFRLLQQQMKQHKISPACTLDAPSDWIRGDTDLLQQAMINFVLNAIEAMPAGGSLTLHTEIIGFAGAPLGGEASASWLRLSISDTGTGIALDDLPHIFDPFYTTKNTGTGLGLSVSHGIITEHGGLIDVESLLGKGTSFHLLLPLCPSEVFA